MIYWHWGQRVESSILYFYYYYLSIFLTEDVFAEFGLCWSEKAPGEEELYALHHANCYVVYFLDNKAVFRHNLL